MQSLLNALTILGSCLHIGEGVGSLEVVQEVVEAPKKAETATQDVKAKPGRPAKAK